MPSSGRSNAHAPAVSFLCCRGRRAAGVEPVVSTPQEFGAQISAEIERWGNVIRATNIKGGG
jgi:hypothetical protein